MMRLVILACSFALVCYARPRQYGEDNRGGRSGGYGELSYLPKSLFGSETRSQIGGTGIWGIYGRPKHYEQNGGIQNRNVKNGGYKEQYGVFHYGRNNNMRQQYGRMKSMYEQNNNVNQLYGGTHDSYGSNVGNYEQQYGGLELGQNSDMGQTYVGFENLYRQDTNMRQSYGSMDSMYGQNNNVNQFYSGIQDSYGQNSRNVGREYGESGQTNDMGQQHGGIKNVYGQRRNMHQQQHDGMGNLYGRSSNTNQQYGGNPSSYRMGGLMRSSGIGVGEMRGVEKSRRSY